MQNETKTNVKDSGLKVNVETSKPVFIELDKAQLVNVLFNVMGVTFIGADVTTIPNMNKGGRSHDNYMFDNVVKDSVIRCMLGFDYSNRQDSVASKQWVADAVDAAISAGVDPETVKKSVASLKEYSTQSIEKFEAKERKWGEHMINPHTGQVSRIMVDYTKLDKVTKQPIPETYKRYMQVEILGAKSPVYRYKDSGEVLSEKDLAVVKQYLKPRKDEVIAIRDYSIENIKNIRINKNNYRITG